MRSTGHIGHALAGAAIALAGISVLAPTSQPTEERVTQVSPQQAKQQPRQAVGDPLRSMMINEEEMRYILHGIDNGRRHKNRAPGERAHRRWRKARAAGRGAFRG